MEIPTDATPHLLVRVHLVEAGSRRGIEASAQLPWRLYRTLLKCLDLNNHQGQGPLVENALNTVLREGFGPLAIALGNY
jgi:hypothetical protein